VQNIKQHSTHYFGSLLGKKEQIILFRIFMKH
jgi:hypothetical protein